MRVEYALSSRQTAVSSLTFAGTCYDSLAQRALATRGGTANITHSHALIHDRKYVAKMGGAGAWHRLLLA